MGKFIKKTLSLALIALLLITSTPAMSYAVEAPLGLSPSNVEQITATVTVENRTPGSNLTITLIPAGAYTVSGNDISFTGLTAGTPYSLNVKETFTVVEEGPFPVVYDFSTFNFYAVTDNGNKVVSNGDIYFVSKLFGRQTGWSIIWAGLGNTHYTDKSFSNEITREVDGSFTTLAAPITYTLNVTEPVNGTVGVNPKPGPYLAGSTVTLTATPADGFQFDGWIGTALTGSEIILIMDGNKEIAATFSEIPEPLHELSLVVGTGGIAFVNDHEYGVGTHSLSFVIGSEITISPYANAGYIGGVPSWNYTVLGTEDEIISVPFTSVPKVYTLDSYQFDGYFSGYKSNGSDITTGHNPMGDVLSATMTATPSSPVLELGDNVAIDLNVTVADGDVSNNKLNEVDFYQNGIDKQTFGNAPDSNPVTFTHTIPTFESELVAAGFILGTPTSTHNIYTKALNYDMVDRYNSNGAAAILATANALLTVQVALPTYTVTFDTNSGSIAPAPQTVVSGSSITEPTDPTKTNFTFSHWALLESTSTEYPFGSPVLGNITLVAQYTAVQPPVQTTTEPPVVESTESNTTVQVTTELEIIEEEEVALSGSNIINFDVLQEETIQETTEALVVEIVLDEATPLADALPQTGQIPAGTFVGLGGLISAAGLFLKRNK